MPNAKRHGGINLSEICGNVRPIAPEINLHGWRATRQPWDHEACVGDRAFTARGSGFTEIEKTYEGLTDSP